MKVFNDLTTRGVAEILIAVTDGLRGIGGVSATSLARAAAVQRIAVIQYPVAVGSVRVWTERSLHVNRSSERPPLMMYFHGSTSGKLSRPLPFRCPAQRISKRGPRVRCISWERKNLPSARLNPSIAR
jgi:hypothetical protein